MRRHPVVRIGIAAALVALVLAAFAPGAEAQAAPLLLIRKVDSSNPSDVKVDFIYTGSNGDVGGAALQQNGQQVQPIKAASPLQTAKSVVFVVDTSPAMDAGGGLASTRQGMIDMVKSSPGVQFAVVQAGNKAVLRQDFTAEASSVIRAIEGTNGVGGLGVTQTAAIWDALTIAGNLYESPGNEGLQPNVLLAVASNDSVAPQNEPVGRSAVLGSGATVFAAERLDQGMDPAPYDSLVNKAGGQVLQSDGAKMAPPVTQFGTTVASQQYQMTYNSNLKGQEPADLVLTVGGQTSDASILIGGVAQGNQALRPEIIQPNNTFAFLASPIVFGLALILVLAAAAGIAYAFTTLFVKDDLSNVLQAYADPYGGEDEDNDDSVIGKSAILQRAVELTEQVAENQGLLTRAEGALERANLPLRAGEALFFYLAIVVAATVLGLLLWRNFVAALVLGCIGALIPLATVNFKAGRRRKKFMSQLPDMLQLLSGTLRAGYSLMQGVEAVSQEVEDPMGLELRRVVTEARLGRPLEESLEGTAERMDSDDFSWAVMAIRIQREVGGNLSELLLTVADTMVARERLRRDVAALTAEGRVSAYILGVMPAGLGVMIYLINPEYVSKLFTDGLGIAMLVLAIVAMLVGFLWMRKIINIEI